MSSTSGPGPNHPSSNQATDPQDSAGAGALGYSDSGTQSPTAEQPATGAGAAALGENAAGMENGDDANPRPLDPSLIAGGENLVGAANDVATGADTMDANFGDDEDAPVRADRAEREGPGQEDDSRNAR